MSAVETCLVGLPIERDQRRRSQTMRTACFEPGDIGQQEQSGSGDVLGSAPLAGSGTFAGLSQMLNVRKI